MTLGTNVNLYTNCIIFLSMYFNLYVLIKLSFVWTAMIISTKILDLVFEEKPGKTWVVWIGEKSVSPVRKYLTCT